MQSSINKISLITFSENDTRLIPPFGLMLLANQLRKNGFEPRIIHLRKEEVRMPDLLDQVSDSFLIGISTLTGSLLIPALSLSKAIKATFGNEITVVWGGVHASMCPEISLKEDSVDFVIIGEGEEAIWKLAEYLKEGKKGNLNNIHGLGFKRDGTFHINPRKILDNLEPYSYAWDLIDVERYIERHYNCRRLIAYITSRGCPYNCAFCYNIFYNKRKWRGWRVEKVVKDIWFLRKRYNIDGIEFYDDYFFTDKKREDEILRNDKILLSRYAKCKCQNNWKNEQGESQHKCKSIAGQKYPPRSTHNQ